MPKHRLYDYYLSQNKYIDSVTERSFQLFLLRFHSGSFCWDTDGTFGRLPLSSASLWELVQSQQRPPTLSESDSQLLVLQPGHHPQTFSAFECMSHRVCVQQRGSHTRCQWTQPIRCHNDPLLRAGMWFKLLPLWVTGSKARTPDTDLHESAHQLCCCEWIIASQWITGSASDSLTLVTGSKQKSRDDPS